MDRFDEVVQPFFASQGGAASRFVLLKKDEPFPVKNNLKINYLLFAFDDEVILQLIC